MNKEVLIKELYHKDILSVRAINVCVNARISTVADLLEFYQHNYSFDKLKNCGNKANMELIAFCKEYSKGYENITDSDINADIFAYGKYEIIQGKFKYFSAHKKSILKNYFLFELSNLNVRARNGINDILDINNIDEIINKLFSNDFHFKNIQNIGSKSNIELEDMRENLFSYIDVLETMPDSVADREYIQLFLKNTFPKLKLQNHQETNNLWDDNRKIKLFALLNFVISYGDIFTNVQQEIFKMLYTNCTTEEISLDLISIKYDLTTERVRQIKTTLEKEIKNYFLFITDYYFSETFATYYIDSNNMLNIIDRDFVNKINEQENTYFNPIFYTTIFEILYHKNYQSLGLREKIYENKPYRYLYLIKTFFFQNFDYEKCFNDVYLKMDMKIESNYSLIFRDFISAFVKNDSTEMTVNDIGCICKIILQKEFGLTIQNDCLIFIRNTKKRLSEYYYEILEKNNRVMTVEEIKDEITVKFPFLNSTKETIRSILIREKEYFIYFGRNSTYGLKKWELEKEDIKGGTIRSITEEFLLQKETPQHIATVTEHIRKYRKDTYARSILDNLKADESDIFMFYSGNYIGLKSKIYQEKDLQFKKSNGVRFTQKVLMKFNNWNINDFINYYSSEFGYTTTQIQFILDNKMKEGLLKVINERLMFY